MFSKVCEKRPVCDILLLCRNKYRLRFPPQCKQLACQPANLASAIQKTNNGSVKNKTNKKTLLIIYQITPRGIFLPAHLDSRALNFKTRRCFFLASQTEEAAQVFHVKTSASFGHMTEDYDYLLIYAGKFVTVLPILFEQKTVYLFL